MDEGTWNFYPCHLNDKPASVCLDLDAHEHQAGLSMMLVIILKLKMPDPHHGMTVNEEYDTLIEFEDAMVPHVIRTTTSKFVGRINH